MTVEEIYQDRKKFSKTVFDVASSDLVNMGLTVVSYTLKDIKDDHGYLKALGMARTAQVICPFVTAFDPNIHIILAKMLTLCVTSQPLPYKT